MKPKFGDVAEIETDKGSVRAVCVAERSFGPESTVNGYSWAMIVSGSVFFDGADRGPGFIGPVKNEGDHIRWIDLDGPRAR